MGFVIAASMMLFAGCQSLVKPVYQDPTLLAVTQPVYDKLLGMGGKPAVTLDRINLQLVDLTDEMYAVCARDNRGITIEFNAFFFNRLSPLQIEQVLLHEIGHCAYKLSHNDSQFDDGRPMSAMNSHNFLEYWFYTYKDYYYNRIAKGQN